jgi:hypothetical protein
MPNPARRSCKLGRQESSMRTRLLAHTGQTEFQRAELERNKASPTPCGGTSTHDHLLSSQRCRLPGAGAKPSVRRVCGASCADAVDAVALIIAVTLDPGAVVREKARQRAKRGLSVPPVVAPPLPRRTRPNQPWRATPLPDLLRMIERWQSS